MTGGYYNLLIIPISPRQEEVDHHLPVVSEITKLDQYTLRQRLQGRGIAVLRRETDKNNLAEISRKLSEANYSSLVFSDSEFRSIPPARRAVTLKASSGRIEFFDARGKVVNSLSLQDDCFLIVGDLNPGPVSARQLKSRLTAPDEELLAVATRGEPVLDIHPRGRSPRIRIFGKRFNYTSMGETANLSAVQNFSRLIEAVRSHVSQHRLDLSFGIGALPPIGGVSLSPTEVPSLSPPSKDRLKQFETHSRLSLFAYEAKLSPPKAPAQAEPTPEKSQAAQAPEFVPPKIGRPPAKVEAFLDKVRQLGPPGVFLPLLVLVAIFGVMLYTTEDIRFLAPAGGTLGLLLFLHGFVCLRRARRIENIPTSRIRSMPMGPVEIAGKAASYVPLKTPYSLVDCVWYSYVVQEYRQRFSTHGRRGGFVTVASGSSEDTPFYVEDDTEKTLVDPRGAVVEVKCREVTHRSPPGTGWRGIGMAEVYTRITETYIPWQYPVYVMGVAQHYKESGDSGRADYLQRLRELKQSPEKLVRFDKNKDGRIDTEEWEHARAAVERELLVEKLESPQTEEVVYIGKGESGELFMISDRSEHELVRSLKIRTALTIFGGGGIILIMLLWGIKLSIF
ncbi:MAG: hypothetical protein JSU92_01615 [Deltaproteobacteria bacterium]|nr:MAG: hypothetical protein JSU92_01615 [Deltaproteobacteria bacterium]